MLSAALKEHTQSAHRELEKIFINRIRSLESRNDYIELLELLYGYYHPLEQSAAGFINTSLLPDHSLRRKSENLLYDLLTLAGTPAPTPVIQPPLPRIASHLHALGALYVLEGSTLGGVIISKMIRNKLQLTGQQGLSYFNSYGDAIPAMWQAFKDALDKTPINSQEQQEVINTANDTFNGLKTWMQYAKQI